jgi:hypothetical protein
MLVAKASATSIFRNIEHSWVNSYGASLVRKILLRCARRPFQHVRNLRTIRTCRDGRRVITWHSSLCFERFGVDLSVRVCHVFAHFDAGVDGILSV